jgi:hypothetical protein
MAASGKRIARGMRSGIVQHEASEIARSVVAMQSERNLRRLSRDKALDINAQAIQAGGSQVTPTARNDISELLIPPGEEFGRRIAKPHERSPCKAKNTSG